MNKEKLFRIWAKISAIIVLIITIDQASAIFFSLNTHYLTALLDWGFWLLLAVKTLPLIVLSIPLIYYGFKKKATTN